MNLYLVSKMRRALSVERATFSPGSLPGLDGPMLIHLIILLMHPLLLAACCTCYGVSMLLIISCLSGMGKRSAAPAGPLGKGLLTHTAWLATSCKNGRNSNVLIQGRSAYTVLDAAFMTFVIRGHAGVSSVPLALLTPRRCPLVYQYCMDITIKTV